MTGASIKDLGSIMTFVNTGKAQNNSLSGKMSFSDMMTKAENGQGMKDIGSKDSKLENKQSLINQSENDNKVGRMDTSKTNVKKTEVSEDTSKLSNDEETIQSLEEAGKTVAEKIADIFDETVEKVEEAMETLALSFVSLLDTSNMGNMVLELSGEQDPMVLVTDENLMDFVNNLTTVVDATIADLAEDMDVEILDVKEFLENMNALEMNTTNTEMSVEANSDEESIMANSVASVLVEEEPEDSNEVDAAKVDNFGANVQDTEKTQEHTDSHSVIKKVNEREESDNNNSASTNANAQTNLVKNPILENLVNNTNNVSGETTYVSEETRNIMDQILEHVKVNIKPDTDEITLQLHPASLGNVKVNLVSKAGEITAEFKVQNEQVRAAVEAQLNDLHETFKASGTKVTAIEVSVEMQSFDSNLWEGKGHGSNENNENRNRKPRRINLNDLDSLFMEEASEEERLAGEMMKATGSTVDYTA